MFDKGHLFFNESHSGKYQVSILLFPTSHPSDLVQLYVQEVYKLYQSRYNLGMIPL